MKSLRIDRRPDGVAIVTLDVPGTSVNTISRALLSEVHELFDEAERDLAIKALVITSGKDGAFIAGADLREVVLIQGEEEAVSFAREGHALLDRMETGSKPVVAAIHGSVMGGGLEIALACHYRVATDSPSTVFSFPEVMLGLLPGGGGTQRLPRLVGLERAVPMLLTGQRIRARKAEKIGLVDALTTRADLIETAARLAWRIAGGELPLRRRTSLKQRVLSLPPLRALVFAKIRKSVARRTRGLYPSPPLIVDAVEAGLARGFRAGQQKEIEGFGKLVVSPESKNLVWLFLATTELKKLPADPPPRPVRQVAVLGAGLMGEGIASVSLPRAGVMLKDVSEEALARAAENIRTSLEKRVASGGVTEVEATTQANRLAISIDPLAVRDADLVIEAVFEELELKRRVLAESEAVMAAEAVFASNTSAIPIARISERAVHPERVLGMHYFSPVPKMPLLEIVRAPATAEWAIVTAQAFGIAQGKTAIVVNDGPGFYTTRILAPYINEAILLLEEGAEIAALDSALKDFGFPVGPVTLLDEVGIDVAAHVSRDLGEAFAARGLRGSDALARMEQAGFRGRKNGRGFFTYREGKKGAVNLSVYDFVGAAQRRKFVAAELVDRLVLLMVNEAAHCLGERILRSPTDGDVGAVLGLGFPPFRGGPFHWIDSTGVREVVARLEALAGRSGPRFTPAPLLMEMAANGARFYAPGFTPPPASS